MDMCLSQTQERQRMGQPGPSALSKGTNETFITVSHRRFHGLSVDRQETILLQLFEHPENSEWFSIISIIIFEVNIVAEQKQE